VQAGEEYAYNVGVYAIATNATQHQLLNPTHSETWAGIEFKKRNNYERIK